MDEDAWQRETCEGVEEAKMGVLGADKSKHRATATTAIATALV